MDKGLQPPDDSYLLARNAGVQDNSDRGQDLGGRRLRIRGEGQGGGRRRREGQDAYHRVSGRAVQGQADRDRYGRLGPGRMGRRLQGGLQDSRAVEHVPLQVWDAPRAATYLRRPDRLRLWRGRGNRLRLSDGYSGLSPDHIAEQVERDGDGEQYHQEFDVVAQERLHRYDGAVVGSERDYHHSEGERKADGVDLA